MHTLKHGVKKKLRRASSRTLKKAPNGTISVQPLESSLRLKYTYQHESYYVYIKRSLNRSDVFIAQLIEYIEQDMKNGTHDDSGERYKEIVKTGIIPPAEAQEAKPAVKTENILPLPLVLYDALALYCERKGRDLWRTPYYFSVYQMLKAWGKHVTPDMVPALLNKKEPNGKYTYVASTYNSRKGVLYDLFKWLLKKKVLSENPLEDVPSRKKGHAKRPERKRLSDEEILRVLKAIETDEFTNHYARRVKHSDYYGIFVFLALTGVRPSEAIGLQVKKIDFENKVITIDQALVKTEKGSTFRNRVLKSTKTEDCREFPFSDQSMLASVLLKHCQDKQPDDFVFLNHMGEPMDDRNLNKGVLRPILKALNIRHRVVYVLRHSFISRCLYQKMDAKSIQALTGHTDHKMIMQIYGEVDKKSVRLPLLGAKWIPENKLVVSPNTPETATPGAASTDISLKTVEDLFLFTPISLSA